MTKSDDQKKRRDDFAQINASNALEGLDVDAELLALQERVIRGELTVEEASAINLCIPVMLTPISSDCDPLALEVLAHLFQRW